MLGKHPPDNTRTARPWETRASVGQYGTLNFDTRQLVRFANEPNNFMYEIRFFAFPVCRWPEEEDASFGDHLSLFCMCVLHGMYNALEYCVSQ